jgi:hypothetical protein
LAGIGSTVASDRLSAPGDHPGTVRIAIMTTPHPTDARINHVSINALDLRESADFYVVTGSWRARAPWAQ